MPLLILLSLVLAPPAAAQDDSPRFFSLPNPRETSELVGVAEMHLSEKRFSEAISVLQRLLEDHAVEVLFQKDAKERADYLGAGEWAVQHLLELPDTARAEYRARYEPRAAEALARARQAPERSNLAALANRWPLAPSSVQAWWALGDLELESGELDAAELAWRRAHERSTQLGLDLAPAAARSAWLDGRPATPSETRAAPTSLPPGDAVPWTRQLDLTPFGQQNSGRSCLQPVSTGELVLVGSTLRLYALDAFTGELRWQAGPPRGWTAQIAQNSERSLFQGINHEQLMLAPAFGDGVALSVMQEPFAEDENDSWSGIEIMKAIPERRLHAFDLGSGRELWNHAPALTTEGLHLAWNGQGTFAQRMMVAGSPTVAGARVLVPCYRMQGRIDYHIACYELATGTLLWSTMVISGQRERNMFGRSVKEFNTTPVVVEGQRVLTQTELGTVAALDLFSGRILWQATYRQIDLPKTRSYLPPNRATTWNLAPPVVVGDVLVCAPVDSRDLMAFSLATGGELWAYEEEQLQKLHRDSDMYGFRHLVGADADTVYLSGGKLSALQKPGGLHSRAPFFARWTRELERPDTLWPRPALAKDVILVPNGLRRTAYDRRSGELVPSASGDWNGGECGNLWLGEGALYALAQQSVAGYFDWQAQLERARRLAAGATGAEPIRAAAELFLRRGSLALESRDLLLARDALGEARALFARLRERGFTSANDSELSCARKLAQALVGLAREADALAVLEGARALATRAADLVELLFQAERILRPRGGAARVALLDEIDASFGEQTVPEETRAEYAATWLNATPGGEASEALAPALGAHLWVAIERAGERVRCAQLAPALEDLHEALRLGRDIELARGLTLGVFLRERIARVLDLPGGRGAFAALEERAAARLARARATDDARELRAVAELFPHARAAESALELLLEHALAAHDAPAVAELVADALAGGGAPSEREGRLLLSLAEVLAERGNAAFERALLASLLRADPALWSSWRDRAGRAPAEILAEPAPDGAAAPLLPPNFGPKVVSLGRQRAGKVEFLGVLRPARETADGTPREIHVYAASEELLAYSSLTPSQPLWRHALEQPLEADSAAAFAAGRLVYASRAGLTCLDEQGAVRWTRALDEGPPAAVRESDGVLLTLSRGTLRAFDSLLGLPLWQHALGASGNWSGPLLGGGHAVVFSQLHAVAPRALVFDLFRGRITADICLSGFDSRVSLAESAWIAEERLILPAFLRRPSQLSAFTLADGRRAWSYDFGRDEEFHAVVRSEGRSFAITLATALGTAAGNGGVYEIDERSGSLRRIVPLKAGEQVMGLEHLEPQRTLTLDAPYLFTYASTENERSVPVRAIHLPFGVQWSWSLGLSSQELYLSRSLPLPAVSAECVAIAYQTRRARPGPGSESAVVFLDKRSGKKLDMLSLAGGLEQANRLELRGLGAALFVLGKGPTQGGTCLDVLEEIR
ncbi:MAG: hypothetical protein EXS08_07535 [Planctomycetes bacterium]|nr:hypothetical protein [Planctomycetota bacterium]